MGVPDGARGVAPCVKARPIFFSRFFLFFSFVRVFAPTRRLLMAYVGTGPGVIGAPLAHP